MIDPGVRSLGIQKSLRRSVAHILLLLGLLMISAIGIFAYWTQYGVVSSRQWVLHTYEVRGELQTLETQLGEARGSALAYTATADKSQLRLFREHAERILTTIQERRRLTADNPRQQNRINDVEAFSNQ